MIIYFSKIFLSSSYRKEYKTQYFFKLSLSEICDLSNTDRIKLIFPVTTNVYKPNNNQNRPYICFYEFIAIVKNLILPSSGF